MEDPTEEEPPSDENQPPTAVATASPDSVEAGGEEVVLDGSDSSDPDDSSISLSWTLSGPEGSEATLSDREAVSPTFTPDVRGQYVAELEASDGSATDTDSATVFATRPTTIVDGDITKDVTWTADRRYRVKTGGDTFGGAILVASGATLTIEPGTEVLFEEDASLLTRTGGTIKADGTAENAITMAAVPGNRVPGSWEGIRLESGSDHVFDHVTIRHTGSGEVDSDGRIPSALEFGRGGYNVRITNSTFETGSGCGVGTIDNDALATVKEFSGNEFSDLDKPPVCVSFKQIEIFDGTNTYPDGAVIDLFGVRVGASNEFGIQSKTTAQAVGVPYRLRGNPEVDKDTLIIEPGTEMRFEQGTALTAAAEFGEQRAVIIAKGSEQDPITFTATSGDEEKGWWVGLNFSRRWGGALENVIVRYGGRGSLLSGNIRLRDRQPPSSFSIKSSKIESSEKHGIVCGTDGVISGVSLESQNNSFSDIPGQNIEGCGN